jgi:hypothetical protein
MIAASISPVAASISASVLPAAAEPSPTLASAT